MATLGLTVFGLKFLSTFVFSNSATHAICPTAFSHPSGQCGGSFTANSTAETITSPGFPGQYAANLRCRWVIEAPEGKTVGIQIRQMGISESVDCETDYLQITDRVQVRVVDGLFLG